VLRRLYDWTMDQATRPYALWMLALISFIESSVFPIPPDILLIPLIIAQRERAFLIAAICTASSVAGGVLGYLIGYLLFEALGQPILAFYGYLDRFVEFQAMYNEHGAWMIAASRFIPGGRWATLLIAGMMHLPRWKFLLADGVAAMGSVTLQLFAGYYIGKLASAEFSTAERWLTLASLAIAAALIGGYVYYRKRHGGPRKPIRLGRFRKTRRNADASA